MQPGLRYDPLKDFAPISTLANAPVVVIIAATLPPKTLRELIEAAKAQPGALKFGSAGTGHFVHIAGEMFKTTAGVDLLHVPYKGVAQALIDLLGGRIDLMFDAFAQYEPHLQSGKLRALAVANPTRLRRLPEVPTTREAGLPDFVLASWFGLAAPAGTPREIVERVNAEVRKAVAAGDVVETMTKLGLEPGTSSPQQYSAMIADELATWRRAVKAAGIKLE
jgi:tripartite-type tricarboxylate transporter receptor subunit TctC